MDHRCTEDKQKDAWAGPCNNLMTVRTYYAFFYAAKASLPVESLFLQDYLKMPRRGCPDPPLQCAFSRVGQNLNAKMLLDGGVLLLLAFCQDCHPLVSSGNSDESQGTLRPAFRHLGNYRCPPHGKEAKTKAHRGFWEVAWRLRDQEGSHGATYLVAW